MKLSKLTAILQSYRVEYHTGDWNREITCISADGRSIGAGGLFVCLSGGNVDGHEYASQAVNNGAAAIVVQKPLNVHVPQIVVEDTRKAFALLAAAFYGNAADNLKIIAITGTNGKTTVSYMLESILRAAGKNVGVIGTLGVKYNGATYPSLLTTPDPVFLHKTLANMFLQGVEYVVMEVSAHALYYQKIAGICFTACIFTNLSQDHLDFFKDMQAYGNTKSLLFDGQICPFAVLNGDEPLAREIGKERGKDKHALKTAYYGLRTPTEAFAVVTEEDLSGIKCLFNINDALLPVHLHVLGEYNVYNALAAATCAVGLGIDETSVRDGLNAFYGAVGRLQRVETSVNAHIFVDFAHTPDGLEQSLKTLKKHCKGRLICCFGCGGNRDKSKRPLMGEIAATYADFCVLTSDNPRYEDALDILSDIERGYRKVSSRYIIIPERKKALAYAVDILQPHDVLLVAGKGGETYQEIMGIKYAFDDYDILKRICKEKGDVAVE